MATDKIHSLEAAIAAKKQQLGLLNERIGDGLWDWELGADTEWYSTRLVSLLDYATEPENEVAYPNELMRLLAQTTETTIPSVHRIRERLAQGSEFDERLNIVDAEGDSIWLRIRGGVTNDPLIGPYSAGAIEDISDRVVLETERVRMSEELERSNAELQTFASVASHDLKAPLRHISALAYQLEHPAEESDSEPLSQEQKLCLGEMQDRIVLMNELLDGLLNYAQVGRPKDRRESVDLEQLASRTFALLAPPREFRFDLECTAIPLDTDQAALQKCLRNLLDNAIKHADKTNPHVRVSIKDRDDCVCIAVDDNGAGIPAEQRTKVFDLFETLEQSNATRGVGMGLAIVKKSVEVAGGTVSVTTSDLGGASIELNLRREPA